jgi:hypothetical protein
MKYKIRNFKRLTIRPHYRGGIVGEGSIKGNMMGYQGYVRQIDIDIIMLR